MSEQVRRKNEEKDKPKKDYYTAVLVCQIIMAVILFTLFSVFIKPSDALRQELMGYIDEEMFDTSEIISSVKEYFVGSSSWAVFGDNVTYVTPNDTTAEAHTTQEAQTTSEAQTTTEAASENETTAEVQTTTEGAAETTEALTGSGGEDMQLYEAAENCSFAPIKTTSPAVKPIKNGRYTSYFGYRINPITGEFSFHTGLDIAAPLGTKIAAAYKGKVTKVGEDNRAGKYIFLTHDDGFVTFYCHCSEILAEEGANINAGETVAKVGSTGSSTGPHLHFEVRKNNIRYNPLHILENDS